MRPQDIIRKKRDGGELSREEIEFFVRGITSGEVADYQSTALLMAIFLNGMTDAEAAALTNAIDRKSTRLNSSHRCISYAVFCLKKKKKENISITERY